MKSPVVVERRRVLRKVFTAASVAAIPLSLSGCASKPAAAPPPPPEPPKPIALLAVLPTTLSVPAESTGFGARQPNVYVPYTAGINSGAFIGVGIIGLAIAYGVGESRRKEREQLMAALSEVNFDARELLDERLLTDLESQRVKTVRITDPEILAELNAGKVDRLPNGVDAILKVKVKDQGYFSSTRAGGYSPMLHVETSICAATSGLEELDGFTYYADWRDGGKDPRWFQTPKESTFKTIDALRTAAPKARAGLQSLVEKFAAKISEDVKRHASGQFRVD